MKRYNMDQFFNWLSKPMDLEDIETWNQANNIIPEFAELFEDFCFSLYYFDFGIHLSTTGISNVKSLFCSVGI